MLRTGLRRPLVQAQPEVPRQLSVRGARRAVRDAVLPPERRQSRQHLSGHSQGVCVCAVWLLRVCRSDTVDRTRLGQVERHLQRADDSAVDSVIVGRYLSVSMLLRTAG